MRSIRGSCCTAAPLSFLGPWKDPEPGELDEGQSVWLLLFPVCSCHAAPLHAKDTDNIYHGSTPAGGSYLRSRCGSHCEIWENRIGEIGILQNHCLHVHSINMTPKLLKLTWASELKQRLEIVLKENSWFFFHLSPISLSFRILAFTKYICFWNCANTDIGCWEH